MGYDKVEYTHDNKDKGYGKGKDTIVYDAVMSFRPGARIKTVSTALLQNVVGRPPLDLPDGCLLEALCDFGAGGHHKKQRFRVLSCGSVGCLQLETRFTEVVVRDCSELPL
jgi:hypothetical protein